MSTSTGFSPDRPCQVLTAHVKYFEPAEVQDLFVKLIKDDLKDAHDGQLAWGNLHQQTAIYS